jgi:hypothetical protein
MTHNKLYGAYSQSSVDSGLGHSVWINVKGEKVNITCVSETDDFSAYLWPDLVSVGEILYNLEVNPVADFEMMQIQQDYDDHYFDKQDEW